LGPADKDSILLLARHLPPEHLLFLTAISPNPVEVDEWLKSIEDGVTVTLLAEPDGTLDFGTQRASQLTCRHAALREAGGLT
jgi:hypothetical protein